MAPPPEPVADRASTTCWSEAAWPPASCARWLREEGAEGSVLLVGREPDPPYNRPPLTKGYLRGEESREDVLYRPDEWWEEQNIELLTRTSVMKLDTGERVATLSTKEAVASTRRCSPPARTCAGCAPTARDLDGIHYLRAFANSDAIRADAGEAERVVLIGGSYIGTEVAASLTAAHGVKCSILMHGGRAARASVRRRPAASSTACSRSTAWRSTAATSWSASRAPTAACGSVVTKARASSSTATVVIVGAGVMPDVMLAQCGRPRAGRERAACAARPASRARCRASSRPATSASTTARCTAAGCASSTGTWPSTRARRPRSTCSGRGVEHDVIPYFFSDLADWASLEYVGPG